MMCATFKKKDVCNFSVRTTWRAKSGATSLNDSALMSAPPPPTTVAIPMDWRTGGVRVVRRGELSTNTAQTAGMDRRAAVTPELGAHALWGGTVDIAAGAATGAHHHGSVESIIYVLEGVARMRWGDALEFLAEAGPGDFIFVPP